MPIADPYPPSDVSAPTHDDWGQTVLRDFESPTSAATVAPGLMSGGSGQAFTQYIQQSFAPSTNNTVASPSLQHSGLTSNLEGMDVDATEDGAPQEPPVDTKQRQDGDF